MGFIDKKISLPYDAYKVNDHVHVSSYLFITPEIENNWKTPVSHLGKKPCVCNLDPSEKILMFLRILYIHKRKPK